MPVNPSFVRISASSPAGEALDVLEALPATYVVVHRSDGDAERFHVLIWPDAMRRLSPHRGAATPVHAALALRDSDAVPVLTPEAPRAIGKTTGVADGVVIDRGAIVGVSHGIHEATHRDVKRRLTASAPEFITPAARATVVVTLTAEWIPTAPELDVAIGSTIEVVVIASGAVVVVGPAQDTFTVEDVAEQRKQFDIAARGVGEGRIEVFGFQDRVTVARIAMTVHVGEAGQTLRGSALRASELRATHTAPDLAIWIQDDRHSRSYTMRVTAADPSLGLNLKPFEIRLEGDIEPFFTAFYDDIQTILTSGDSPREKHDLLSQKGLYLYEKLVPAALREQLWKIQDRVTTVQIQSEEPWVPWEICKLSGKVDGIIDEGPFLSERYQVTRWFPAVPQHKQLTMRKIGVVVPPDSRLAAAPAEQAALLDLAGPERSVTQIEPRPVELRTALASRSHDALHFVGHGAFVAGNADRSSIKLQGGSRFSPEDLAGRVGNFGATRPLVFLNACAVGRAGTALGGKAGWPQAFVTAGAAAFIGPFWNIADGSGSRFASLFYDQLLGRGATVGEAIHHARNEIRKASDPTWLAYVAYAHPDARVVP